jgi:hypothetical protein
LIEVKNKIAGVRIVKVVKEETVTEDKNETEVPKIVVEPPVNTDKSSSNYLIYIAIGVVLLAFMFWFVIRKIEKIVTLARVHGRARR